MKPTKNQEPAFNASMSDQEYRAALRQFAHASESNTANFPLNQEDASFQEAIDIPDGLS